MRRNLPSVLDSLDPDSRDAARQAARRAGLTLDEWIADTLAGEAERLRAEEPRTSRRLQARVAEPVSRRRREEVEEDFERPAFAEDEPLDRVAARIARAARLQDEAERRERERDEAERREREEAERQREQAARAREEERRLEAVAAAAAEAERRARVNAEKTAASLDGMARWIERAEDRLEETARATAERQERTSKIVGEALSLVTKRLDETARFTAERQEKTAGALGDALAQVTRRLDEIEDRIAEGRKPTPDPALAAIARLEAQLARSVKEAPAADTRLESVLKGFETRIADLTERLASSRAVPVAVPANDVQGAIVNLGARETAAAGGGTRRGLRPVAAEPPRQQGDILRSLQSDIARLAGQLETMRPAVGHDAALASLRTEMVRLREAAAGLATGGDVAELERSVRELTRRMAETTAPAELEAVRAALGVLQGEIRRLNDLMAGGLPTRLSRDLDLLSRKLDVVAGSGVDPAAVSNLAREIAELRSSLREGSDPDRVERLALEVAELSRQVAVVAERSVGLEQFETLRLAVEDIRGALVSSRPAAGAETLGAAFTEQVDALSRKIDRIASPQQDLAAEIERLTARLEEAMAAPPEPPPMAPLIERLDRLDASLRQPVRPDLKPIEALLSQLAGRLDQAERSGAAPDALDALERQVAQIADRLERGRDPALAHLERTLGDLMAQVESVRGEAAEAVERAARTAVAESLRSMPPAPAALDKEFAELKASYAATDRRTHATLEALHATLEKVAGRLASPEPAPERPTRAPSRPAESARAPEAAPAPRSSLDHAVRELADLPVGGRPGRTAIAPGEGSIVQAAETLLEPGAGRPRPDRAAVAAAPDADGSDIKASFIAAARRAAQTAASEAAAVAKPKGGTRLFESGRASGEAKGSGLVAQLRETIDRRRRPILLGIAAIVLTIGALQIVGGLVGGRQRAAPAAPQARIEAPAQPPTVPAPPAAEPTVTNAIPAAKPEAPSLPPQSEAKPASPSFVAVTPLDPIAAAKTEAPPLPIGPATEAKDKPAEKIPGMSAVEIPREGIPAGLRQAAVAGDSAAVYELAARAAEGRGMTRDLKLAARLFEKAAAHGMAPAQYRIGNHYEKGLGVARDLQLAKRWYLRAADKGNARAMHNLAVLLAEGVDGRPDYAGAVEWFRRAAGLGVRDSQFNLGVLLARGLGTAQDLPGSYHWFAVAAGQGDDDAGKKRDEIGTRLPAAELNAAKAKAERWRPEAPSVAGNEVAIPPHGWAETPKETARKPAPAPRG